jgi:uncharacterized protein (TIGR03435 family)
MPDVNDMDLVRQFASQNSEVAFDELVHRHIDMVYSAAIRFTGNAVDAQDVTQAVFIILAKKAVRLSERTVITGWLYETTRFASARFLRTQNRRHMHEQEAYMQSSLNEPDSISRWTQLAPYLEAAMSRLSERDRALLAFRFYQKKTGAEAAALLGIREDAAHKRTARALEKLRSFFSKRGIALSAVAIASAVTANSVQAAPVGFAKTVSTLAITKSAAASSSILPLVKGTLKMMTWVKAKTAVVLCASALFAAGTAKVTIDTIEEHENEKWQLGNFEYELLTKPPFKAVILPTKVSLRSKHGTSGISMAGGRILEINSSPEKILYFAYSTNGSLNPCRTLIKAVLPTNKFDFISNLPKGAKEALRLEIEKKFKVVGRFETIETNVFFLRANDPEKLTPSTSKISQTSIGEGKITAQGAYMDFLADSLENFIGIPVIDKTALTNKFDLSLQWGRSGPDQAGSDDLRKTLLNQLGLELIPGIAPVEMLIVEPSK